MSRLLIDDKPVMVLPKLAQAIGLNGAIVLQQIHYWIEIVKEAGKQDHFRDGSWWIYNTKTEWTENFPWWSEATVWRVLLELRNAGLIIARNYNSANYDRTLWYTIDYAALAAIEAAHLSKSENAFYQIDKMDYVNLTSPIPETNTENNLKKEDFGVSKDETPIASQTSLDLVLSDSDTTEPTLAEDAILFDAINRDRKANNQRAVREKFDTLQQKAKWRATTETAKRLFNGQQAEILAGWVNTALEKGIRNKPGIIAYVAKIAENQADRRESTLRVY